MLNSEDGSTGAVDIAKILTHCKIEKVCAQSYTIPVKKKTGDAQHENEYSSKEYRELVQNNSLTSNFLTNLPLKVLEYIVGYLSVIDTLIMCHSSPSVDEHVSLLHDAWKRKWTHNLCFTNDKLESVLNWKEECERALALLLKCSEQAMLNPPENVCLRACVTATDYCDQMLLCFGEARARRSTDKIYAHMYQCINDSYKAVATFPVPGQPISISACCLVSGYKIFAGSKDGTLYVWNFEPSSQQVSLVSTVLAHTDTIEYICADEDLGIVATAGEDCFLRFWNLKGGAGQLASFAFPGIKKVKILCGDKSPFIGYNCVVVIAGDEFHIEFSVHMVCWGKDIPLRDAVIAYNICHPEKLYGIRLSFIIPDVHVQGGSVVYGLKLLDDSQRSVCNLVWQPLDPDDFFGVNSCRKNQVLDHFRSSLHPSRPRRITLLPKETIHILGVGKYFSVTLTKYNYKYSANLTLTVNETGDSYKFSYSWIQHFSGFNVPAKMVSTKWLDGFDNIQPGSICVVLANNDEGFRIWAWRKDALDYNKPSVSELLAVKDGHWSVSASLV